MKIILAAKGVYSALNLAGITLIDLTRLNELSIFAPIFFPFGRFEEDMWMN
ncbi:MAG: hypothetical protein WBW94_08075 [Anaerolineales bacterium]